MADDAHATQRPGVTTWARSRLAAIRQALAFRVPPFARAAFTGVVASGHGVVTGARSRRLAAIRRVMRC